MTTRNIAPRENGEGNIGTQLKRWLKGWFNSLDVAGGNVEVSDVNGVGGNVSTTKNISIGGNLSVSGTATGVTPAPTDNSTKFATTEFVQGFQRTDGWNAGKAYSIGNTVKTTTLPSPYVLSCIDAGTSSSVEPDCTNVGIGDTVIDNSITWLVTSYLPVTGGTIVDDVALTSNKQIKSTADDGQIKIQGGRDENMGARLVLGGKSRSTNPGAFELTASNGTATKTLVGTIDGTLSWDGKKITENGIATNKSYLSFYLNSTNPNSEPEAMQLHSTGLQLYGKGISGAKYIYLNGDGNIFGSKSSGGFVLYCGSGDEAPSLTMWGPYSNSNGGCFRLRATLSGDSSRTKDLIGTPDGSLKWGGQPVQTSSDKRLKTDLSDVPADVLDAWGKVDWKQFKYIADKERKGKSCRFHTGLVAQDVKGVCESQGVDITKYGILCYDNESDLWTVRYEEALAMEVICLRKTIADLEARLQAVENRG